MLSFPCCIYDILKQAHNAACTTRREGKSNGNLSRGHAKLDKYSVQ